MAKRVSKQASEVRSYASALDALLKISRTIAYGHNLEEILRLVVEVTAELMDSKICSVMLLDKEKKELAVKATQSMSERYNTKPPVKLGEGIAGLVALRNEPIAVLDVKEDPRYLNRDVAQSEGLCSLLSVPLCVQGEMIGVMNCYTSVPHEFNQFEKDVISAAANQAAVAIQNAQLAERSKAIQEELEARKLIERAKDILMQDRNLSGEEAFRRLRKQSMDSRRSMREIAEAIILAHEIGRNDT